jgi:asparagine synthase (glutamine-hydrolysing)
MSGFAGMISLDGAPPDRQLLEKMAAQLAFRGPDGTHIRTQPGAGFCFTFLRTGPAPQCPSQPCTLDGRVWLLGDVRLDGRDDVRLKLEQHGEELSADATDEELILRTWRLWGEEGVGELIGDYAFALWDAEARELRCWRDLMGSRPFFYAQAGGWLYFSNTLNAIRCAPGISRELDHHFIGDFLLTDWCQYPQRTAFRDVTRLPAAHYLKYADKELLVHRYTSLPVEEPLFLRREEEYVERFCSLMERAVLDRLPDGPAAIYMSGGLDSTGIAAIAVESAKKRGLHLNLKAYTFDYRPLFNDQEGILARLTADHVGITIQMQFAASRLPYADAQITTPETPEPYHDPFRSFYVEQHRLVAKHARVAFNGFGGDGVLTGQSWPYLKYLLRGRQFRKIAGTFGKYVLQRGRVPPLRGGFRHAFYQWINHKDPMANYPQWLAAQFEKEMCLGDRWRQLQRPPEGTHHWHPKGHAILNSTLWPGILEMEGPAWTTVPLESRAPLLDLRLQRFLLRIPPVPLCINKELLRRALRGKLPTKILSRPKTPFQSDQIVEQVRRYGWSPLPLPPPSTSVRDFVDWDKLAKVLTTMPIRFPWTDLRPISLMRWLRAIESPQRIQ